MDGRTRGERRVGGAQPLERAPLPRTVPAAKRQPFVRAVGEHVQESQRPHATHLTPDPSPQPLLRLSDLDHADQFRKRCQPPREADAVQDRIVMTDQ